ncbi:protein RBL-like [Phaseolus vulgaris]
MAASSSVVDDYLDYGHAKCIAFNRRGTLLAVGCKDGRCVIWDFETRCIVKELKDEECSSPINSVCWSRSCNHLLVSSADQSLTLWDVKNDNRITRIVLQKNPLQARLHPRSSKPPLCLACPLSVPPLIVDLNTEKTTSLHICVLHSRCDCSDATTFCSPTPACFNKYGNLVYVGTSKGKILLIDYIENEVHAMILIPGDCEVKNIVFSRNGRYLLANSSDRIIRIYENLLPLKDEVKALDALKGNFSGLKGTDKLQAVGSNCLTLIREMQDLTMISHWKSPCFSDNGEWVVAGSASKGGHKIYIWDKAIQVKILEGPKESIVDLAWHPARPIVVSVCLAGKIHVWAKDVSENCSVFVPFVEREDEFDLKSPETEKEVKRSKGDEVEEGEIVENVENVEKGLDFSDSDMSQEELCFLPASPTYNVPELTDKLIRSSPESVDSNNSSPSGDTSGEGTNRRRTPSQ